MWAEHGAGDGWSALFKVAFSAAIRVHFSHSELNLLLSHHLAEELFTQQPDLSRVDAP
jgi:hypothetical protein